MSFQPTTMLQVNYCRGDTLVPMGRLALKDRKILFEYTPDFLELGLELSPFKLPLKPGVIACEDPTFEGLFGVFNDSLPDGWGRLLLDRKLMSLGLNPRSMTPLDRLRYVGKRGMGALQYEPEIEDQSSPPSLNNLDLLAEEALKVQEDDEAFVDHLLALNGSSAGARPKILVSLLPAQDDKLALTNNKPSEFHNDWIIKFRSSIDPKDIGSIEYAYHLMAVEAGLDVPEARLFPSQLCPGYFGVKRFDREGSKFFHMHTLSGLLHADHRLPSLDYETVLKTTLWLTKSMSECEKQFRNAVFNVLTHNRDDHAKNFSFLMGEHGTWRVSPAYDLTFSSGPAGEHCTTVMGEGRNPGLSHLLKLATIANIPQKKAKEIIEQVKAAISKWPQLAQAAHVSNGSSKTIHTTLTSILKNI